MKEFYDLLPKLNENELEEVEKYLLGEAQEKSKKERLSDYFTWVQDVWVTARGTPLDFKKRKYLREVYTTQAAHMVFQKGAQLGVSERGISESVWVAEQKGKVVLYVFPAQAQLGDFVQARLDPVLNMSDYLKDRVDAPESQGKKLLKVGLKKIGKGFVYLRGSQNEKQIISVDADMVVMDERDRFNEENVPFIEKRMNASDLKWIREISTPTLPGIGINKAFLNSDQRVWEIPCPQCGIYQELDFFKSVDFDRKTVRCIHCQSVMDRYSDGRWTPLNPESKIVGFKLNGLYNPNVSIASIVDKYKVATETGASALQQFFNQDLGLPYEEGENRIVNEDLDRCKRDYLAPLHAVSNCFAGADVGVNYIHCIVVQKIDEKTCRIVWAGMLKHFTGPASSLQQIMDKYHIKTLVIDKKPETKKVQELIEMYPRRVYAASYPSMNFTVQQYCVWDDIEYEVKIDRTISLDYTVSGIQNQSILFPKNIESYQGFYDHMKASIRITEKNDKTGVETARWIEKGPDHYFHTLNYANVAQSHGEIGKALLDYYANPEAKEASLSPNFIHWLKVNGQKLGA